MKRYSYIVAAILTAFGSLLPAAALAADQNQSGAFSLQVSPSPIVMTVEPGKTSTAQVKIRNTGTTSEQLKMGLRAFSVNSDTGTVDLKSEEPKDVVDWVQFSDPTFTVASGALFTQTVTLSVPETAGFNYSFALLVSRANPRTGTPGKAAIEGSVAIFTLLSVNRPGATKKVEVLSFSSKKKIYEFLPGEFTLKLKNSGNTILAPAGNVFIQKNANSNTPLAVLPVNATGAYILPDVTRSVTSEWSDGFPVYKKDANGKQKLTWNWGTLQNLRIGKYVAKAVVIYNDGTRDIPVEATVSFWVIPWRLLAVLFVVLVLITVGVITTVRKTARLAHKKEKDEPKKG